jgi:hypothetical protein
VNNLIYVALVAFALKTAESTDQASFEERFLELFDEVREAGMEWSELPWYEDFLATISADAPLVSEMFEDFYEGIEKHDPQDLLFDASEIRHEMLVEAAPPFKTNVSKFMCTFTIEWADGTTVDYVCRPFGTPNVLNLDLMNRLTHLFTGQFLESMLHPGIDVFHDQSARLFKQDKFEELLGVLHEYISKMDNSERGPYSDVVRRLEHRFKLDPEIKPPPNEDLVVLQNGGGFKAPKEN